MRSTIWLAPLVSCVGGSKVQLLTIVDQGIVSAGNFLTVLVLANLLSVQYFGYFADCWIAVLFTSSLIMGAIVFPLMTTYASLDIQARPLYLQGNIDLTAMCFLIASIVVLLMLGVLWPLIGVETTSTVFAVLACVSVVHLQEVVRRTFIVRRMLTRVLAYDFVNYGLRLLLLLAVALIAQYTAVVALCLIAMSSIVSLVVIQPALGHVRERGGQHLFLYAWRLNTPTAIWLLPSGVMKWTSVNLFITATAIFLGPTAMASVRVCQSLVGVSNVGVQAAENIIPLQASYRFKDEGKPGLRAYLRRIILISLVPMAAFVAIVWGAGGYTLNVLYGPEYTSARYLLVAFAVAQCATFLELPIRAGHRVLCTTIHWFGAYSVGTVFAVASVYVLLHQYGADGVGLGIVMTESVILAYATWKLVMELKK